MPISIKYAKPRFIIVHNPQSNVGIQQLNQVSLAASNFSALPDLSKLQQEFTEMVHIITASGVKTIDIAELVSKTDLNILSRSANSIFTRDTMITLPWAPHTSIICNMSLPERQPETDVMANAALKCGISRIVKPPTDVRLEGGDILALEQDNKRVLYVGIGNRTNFEAAMWLAETLIKQGHLDEIICLQHNRAMLHLDTCFSILPNRIILCAVDTFRDGFSINQDLVIKPIEPLHYFKEQLYRFVYIPQAMAEREEGCNILYLGNGTYLSLKMPEDITNKLEHQAGINLIQFDGSEIVKANGGVHCLTQPVY